MVSLYNLEYGNQNWNKDKKVKQNLSLIFFFLR